LAESLENQKRDEEKTKKLQELIETKDEIQDEIKNQREISTDLDTKLREWERKIRQKQTSIGGANAADTFNATVRKQERVLENRLDTVCKLRRI
jgi:chromosome segregation ATPase